MKPEQALKKAIYKYCRMLKPSSYHIKHDKTIYNYFVQIRKFAVAHNINKPQDFYIRLFDLRMQAKNHYFKAN